jgi:hypothetical protein
MEGLKGEIAVAFSILGTPPAFLLLSNPGSPSDSLAFCPRKYFGFDTSRISRRAQLSLGCRFGRSHRSQFTRAGSSTFSKLREGNTGHS